MRVLTQARRDAIMEAAAELFEEVGYENSSMSELVKRLGGSKATVYRYFSSKEELLVAVVKTYATEHWAKATAELEASLEGGPALTDTLIKFGNQALQILANDSRARAINRVVVTESGNSAVGELFRNAGPNQMVSALCKLLSDAMERGEIRNADAQLVAGQFIALLMVETNHRMYEQDPPMLEPSEISRMVNTAVEFFLLAMAPAKT